MYSEVFGLAWSSRQRHKITAQSPSHSPGWHRAPPLELRSVAAAAVRSLSSGVLIEDGRIERLGDDVPVRRLHQVAHRRLLALRLVVRDQREHISQQGSLRLVHPRRALEWHQSLSRVLNGLQRLPAADHLDEALAEEEEVRVGVAREQPLVPLAAQLEGAVDVAAQHSCAQLPPQLHRDLQRGGPSSFPASSISTSPSAVTAAAVGRSAFPFPLGVAAPPSAMPALSLSLAERAVERVVQQVRLDQLGHHAAGKLVQHHLREASPAAHPSPPVQVERERRASQVDPHRFVGRVQRDGGVQRARDVTERHAQVLPILGEEDLAPVAEQPAPDHVARPERRPVRLPPLTVVVPLPVLAEVGVRVRLPPRPAVEEEELVGEPDRDAATRAGVEHRRLEVVDGAALRARVVGAHRAGVV
eukprot:CAMPEP_0195656042 /NCGR_PEP_ID=MMETSP0815-20121206/34787_1 /TAXON_ID=97485 /ORGANISM="Prymnesium parvum, Strain Texoma1" /LENGTH=415 /DNA_ID=CAMNT_0040800383 /DNA_START=362 /DNA_END=1610 /DNA_ORIENTATION=+